ncbi:MAG: thermonuclease family protein [Candidatus Cloacimonetes bacterium]|nr:thermonuclease family protein [Candidatus Cloacimonadota bacterium]
MVVRLKKLHLSTKYVKYYAILLFVFACLNANIITGKVTAVQDGDTIDILSGQTRYRIRLDGIDCPEKKQAYGEVARKFTSERCFGKVVRADIKGKDVYGRHLAVVFYDKAKNLNRELLRQGLAWHYKAYNKDKQLSKLESKARKEKLGLWKEIDPQQPWVYRKKGKSK